MCGSMAGSMNMLVRITESPTRKGWKEEKNSVWVPMEAGWPTSTAWYLTICPRAHLAPVSSGVGPGPSNSDWGAPTYGAKELWHTGFRQHCTASASTHFPSLHRATWLTVCPSAHNCSLVETPVETWKPKSGSLHLGLTQQVSLSRVSSHSPTPSASPTPQAAVEWIVCSDAHQVYPATHVILSQHTGSSSSAHSQLAAPSVHTHRFSGSVVTVFPVVQARDPSSPVSNADTQVGFTQQVVLSCSSQSSWAHRAVSLMVCPWTQVCFCTSVPSTSWKPSGPSQRWGLRLQQMASSSAKHSEPGQICPTETMNSSGHFWNPVVLPSASSKNASQAWLTQHATESLCSQAPVAHSAVGFTVCPAAQLSDTPKAAEHSCGAGSGAGGGVVVVVVVKGSTCRRRLSHSAKASLLSPWQELQVPISLSCHW
mmetsp:Transcript_56414/g.128248  ORF Transcript_56414/g.128248 Transcript_56414/m.128248 type:complete len:426 (-) Transcript_56414:763-2040(-)